MEANRNLQNVSPRDVMVLAVSNNGELKRVTLQQLDRYEGRYLSGLRYRKDRKLPIIQAREPDCLMDRVKRLAMVNVHKEILFFSNRGKVFSRNGEDLRSELPRNTAFPVDVLFNVQKYESLIEIFYVDDQSQYLVFGTRRGKIKRLTLYNLKEIPPSGLKVMTLTGGDEVVSAKLAKEDDDIMFVSEEGMVIRFSVNDLPVRPRTAGGVKGISLRTDDRVVAMDTGDDYYSRLVPIGEREGTYGAVRPLGDYPRQGRGGLGLRAFRTSYTNSLRDAKIINDNKPFFNDRLYVFSDLGRSIKPPSQISR